MPTSSGHRALSHTADLIIEAWGPSREACMSEAVAALAATFAEAPAGADTELSPVDLEPDSDTELLVRLLEEVLYLSEVAGVLPLRANLSPTPSGGLSGSFEVVPIQSAVEVGSVPKGIARHGLELSSDGERWNCRVTVDV